MTLGGCVLHVLDALRSARVERSARCLARLAAGIPHEVPTRRDITWLELRRVTPAILARRHAEGLAARLMALPVDAPANFAVMKGLIVVGNPAVSSPDRLETVAGAICAIRCRWLVPSAARCALLSACEKVEWGSAPADLAMNASRKAFRMRSSMALWRRLLGELARTARWDDIRAEARRHPVHTRLACMELRGGQTKSNPERLLVAELIAVARCRSGDSGRELARRWLLPLVSRSTGRFMARTCAARHLSEQLRRPCHVLPDELAEAIEGGIAPNAEDDYTNLRAAFSTATWERLHGAFRSPAVFTELERFACEHDRFRFWCHIESKGETQ